MEEEAVPVVVSHGQRICSDEEFSAVQRQGFGFYALEAGCAIATDPAQPLPTDVSQDIQRRLEAIGLDDPADNGNSGVNNGIAEQALLADIQSTGKGAITLRLRRMAVPHGDGTFGGFRWVASAGVGWWWMQWERDRDVLRQNVDAWISENTTPGSWVVFVGPGEQVSPLP